MHEQWIPGSFSPCLPRAWVRGYTPLPYTRTVITRFWLMGLWCMVPEFLVPIILACTAWGHQWCGHQAVCNCDNQVVVACLRTRTSKHKGLMHLLRCLVFVEAHFNCHIYPAYINTRLNHLADDLSRNNLLSFLSKVQGASRVPSPVSGLLLDLLLDPQADWTCPTWH